LTARMFCIQQLYVRARRIIPRSLFLRAEKRFRSAEHCVDNVNYTFCAGQRRADFYYYYFSLLVNIKGGGGNLSVFSYCVETRALCAFTLWRKGKESKRNEKRNKKWNGMRAVK